MARLNVVYTEEIKGLFLYRDCDVEAVCRSWLDKLVETKECSFVYQFTVAQELFIKTMQMLLIRDFLMLTPDDVSFYIEDEKVTMNNDWHFHAFPDNYPDYQCKCLDVIWDL